MTQYAYADACFQKAVVTRLKCRLLSGQPLEAPDNVGHSTVSGGLHEVLAGSVDAGGLTSASKDKMSGPKAHLPAFYLRRLGRVLPLYYGAWSQNQPSRAKP